ncbi:MAG: nuclear transport factor 2 family protein [Herpetosiphonaceae bacterium]|nr:nuclear transport factor 2 family protein [Herpetosiphonaceae bacterium]
MDHQQLETWVQGYLHAWGTNNPDAIGQLFSTDARYYTEPFAEPWQGRATIVTNWLERKDEPGTYSFRYEILGVTGERGFVRGWTQYHDPPRQYSNLWVITFDRHGLCHEFTEWWMAHK